MNRYECPNGDIDFVCDNDCPICEGHGIDFGRVDRDRLRMVVQAIGQCAWARFARDPDGRIFGLWSAKGSLLLFEDFEKPSPGPSLIAGMKELRDMLGGEHS